MHTASINIYTTSIVGYDVNVSDWKEKKNRECPSLVSSEIRLFKHASK